MKESVASVILFCLYGLYLVHANFQDLELETKSTILTSTIQEPQTAASVPQDEPKKTLPVTPAQKPAKTQMTNKLSAASYGGVLGVNKETTSKTSIPNPKLESKTTEKAPEEPAHPPKAEDTAFESIKMVRIKGGTFSMGCTSEQGSDCEDDEKPSHRVTVSDFYISRYEVTQKEWRDVMGSNPSYFENCGDCPVEQVSWNDIHEFLRKLNAKTGKNYRLPTEAEWEYAARGGNLSRGYKYAGSNSVDEVAWYTSNSGSKTHPVGEKKPNELGLYDMSGNVDEWCQDWYGNYSFSTQTNPTGPSTGSGHVTRGGSWIRYPEDVRITYRHLLAPHYRVGALGFRLARGTFGIR